MKATLLIPYIPIKENFDAPYISPEDYIKMLEDEQRKTSALIKNSNIGGSRIRYNSSNNMVNNYHVEKPVNYYEFPVTIFDINGQPENTNNLIRYYQTKEMFIMIIDMGIENTGINNYDDIMSDIKFWVRNSLKIQNDKDIDPDSKLRLLPEKTFRLLINKNATAELENCRLVEEQSNMKLAMIVKTITFLKN